jgi:hypothetical protein
MAPLPGASWMLQEKVAPDHMPSSGMCDSPATDSNVTSEKHYVAVTGSDSNPGTIYLPWRTIQHAANSVEAGETVYIRGGVYNESVDIEVSGSAAEGSVTFESYPAEDAILDGSGLAPPASDIRGLINIEDQSYVTIRGLEIRNYHTSNASSTPAGIWVTGAGSHIQILNNVVHGIGTSAEASGDAMGVAVYGTDSSAALENIAISGNQLYDLKTGNSEALAVSGNVTNFAVTCNVIHDANNTGIAASGFEEVASDPAIDYVRNGTISRNTLYNISAKNNAAQGNEYNADGISVDSASQVTVERNLLDKVDIGIEVGSQHKGHVARDVIVRNNLLYHANSAAISIGGDSPGVGGVDRCTVVNNTLFQNDRKNTGSGEFQIQYHANNIVFKNNIVSASSQGLLVNNFTKGGMDAADLDYNLYFSSVSTWDAEFLWRGKDYTGFSAYQKATGRDRHSKYADPKFFSLETIDLRVQSASPAVSAAVDLSGEVNGNLDYVGSPRVHETKIDIGAFQLQVK